MLDKPLNGSKIEENDGNDSDQKSDVLSCGEFLPYDENRIEEGKHKASGGDHGKKSGCGQLEVEKNDQIVGQSVCNTAQDRPEESVAYGFADSGALLAGADRQDKHQNCDHCQGNDHKEIVSLSAVNLLLCFLYSRAHTIAQKGEGNKDIPLQRCLFRGVFFCFSLFRDLFLLVVDQNQRGDQEDRSQDQFKGDRLVQEENSVETGDEQRKRNDQAGLCERAVADRKDCKKSGGCIGERKCGGGDNELGAIVGISVDDNEECHCEQRDHSGKKEGATLAFVVKFLLENILSCNGEGCNTQ